MPPASLYARVPITLFLFLSVFGSAHSEVIARKSFSYFDIRGKTADDLDNELTKHGPATKNAAGRHPGATKIKFGGDVTYLPKNGQCSVANVRVTVDTEIILPRWRNRKGAEKELPLIWDTLASDIKRHEERHAEIARIHARAMERQLLSLRPERNCDILQQRVTEVSAQGIEQHDRDQEQFDRVEAVNFQSRLARLLQYRMKARGQ